MFEMVLDETFHKGLNFRWRVHSQDYIKIPFWDTWSFFHRKNNKTISLYMFRKIKASSGEYRLVGFTIIFVARNLKIFVNHTSPNSPGDVLILRNV